MRLARLLRGRGFHILCHSLFILNLLNQLISCQSEQVKRSTTSLRATGQHTSKNIAGQIPNSAKRSAADEGQCEQSCSAVASGFLLADSTDLRLNLSDPIDRNLSEILNRDGPDTRPSRDYHDFKDITMDISKRAWSLMHEHISVAVREQVDLARPALERFMEEARASRECISAVETLLDAAKRLDSWAIRMLNSWGHFPMSGIYEGTYGSVGAFDTCVDIEQNKLIGHAHYCSVTFRPLLPSQKDYEPIVRQEPKEFRQMFEKLRFDQAGGVNVTKDVRLDYERSSTDALTDLLEHAQYHHFIYYKWGTCWPIQCSPFDVRRIAKLFGRRSILLNGAVKCYSKNVSDYEQPGDIGSDELFDVHETGGADATKIASNNKTESEQSKRKKKLVISTWDQNNGIFIWKPHFKRPHKIAFYIFVVVTVFILIMTLIDLLFVRFPPLYRKLLLCFKGLPLTEDHNGRTAVAARNKSKSVNFALCGGKSSAARGGVGGAQAQRHPTRAEFAMLPDGDELAMSAVGGAGAGGCRDALEPDEELVLPLPPPPPRTPTQSLFMSVVDDCSIVTNVRQFFRVSEGQMRNDILCLNGVRCITMIWIIMTHTMMYNDWSAFGRTRDIEVALNSLLSQPIFNGSYLVDTFFLMSGLLSAFTAFKHCQGQAKKFNSFAFIFGRWLRLTPQIFFVSMIFIFFPALSYGPHWYPIVGEFSENCVNNWWINVLHIQAFYKQDHMCNFVTWWISIDFFYHFVALAVIWIIIWGGHKYGSASMAGIIGSAVLWQSVRHFKLGLPPNILSTIPQTGAMWTTMTLDFYWTPYAHSVPFFFGFYIGYLMALKQKLILRFLNTRRALIGWLLAVGLLLFQSYSTFWWVTGKAGYSRPVSTLFFGACSFIWNGSLCWIIIACEHGYGGFMNRVLSWKVFIVLGKSSYMIYLSHFMVLFIFFGNQYLFLEPSPLNMVYIVLGNIVMSTLLGVFLCSVYELPWLKTHRRLMKYV